MWEVLCAVRCALCAVCLWEVQWLYAVCLRGVGAERGRSGGGVRIVRVGEWVKRSVEVHGRWCISLRVAWNVRPTSRIPVFTMHPNLDPTPPCLHTHTHMPPLHPLPPLLTNSTPWERASKRSSITSIQRNVADSPSQVVDNPLGQALRRAASETESVGSNGTGTPKNNASKSHRPKSGLSPNRVVGHL